MAQEKEDLAATTVIHRDYYVSNPIKIYNLENANENPHNLLCSILEIHNLGS